MEWTVWKPLYHQILDDFGYAIEADLLSANRLSKLVGSKRVPDYGAIVERLGQRVIVAGAAASLETDISTMPDGSTLISAGSATARLMKLGIRPDILVTDLDGDVEYEVEAIEDGSLAFIHAHGDNLAKIEDVLPRLTKPFVPTVQCKPFGNVYNFGGFTDGDRAVLMAMHFGAETIKTIGWDLDRPYPKEGSDPVIKLRKLGWVRRILLPYIDGI